MNTLTAVNLMLSLLIEAQKIGAVVGAAQAAGRSDLTPDEMREIVADADAARDRLAAAVAAAKVV